jgi:hypothetical protein
VIIKGLAQAAACLLLTSSPVQATGYRLERPLSYQASTNAALELGQRSPARIHSS